MISRRRARVESKRERKKVASGSASHNSDSISVKALTTVLYYLTNFRFPTNRLHVYMQSFSEQCLDMARSMLGHNLSSINPDGSITPVEGEEPRVDESGHAALAIGEFYRATNETTLDGHDLIDLAARLITAQAFRDPPAENGLAYAALGLLSFGPSKERNPVWERLVEPTRERLDKLLLARSDYDNHWQAFNVAKSVARYSMGLSKKDETGKLIDRFLERIAEHSSNGFIDDSPEGIGGAFNIYGILTFVFIRQSLQLHANINLRERKLPSLRTHAEKYIRMLPDMTRQDGLGWAYGRSIGAYGQMHCISLLLQAFRDGWIVGDQQPKYFDVLRRLFMCFFTTYLDQEHGYLVIRDEERNTVERHTTRMANFDGARYLSQWSRLAATINAPTAPKPLPAQSGGRFVVFDKGNRKEQGLYIYRDDASDLHLQLPLVGSYPGELSSDDLPFPHCPGIFEWPVESYLPIMIPELTIEKQAFIPAYYGKRCVTGLGPRNSFYFRYEQPELVTREQKIVTGLGSWKVSWSFSGKKILSEFAFTAKNNIQLDSMHYALVIGAPHSRYQPGNTLTLGPGGLGCEVVKDDFQATWQETDVVSNDPNYRSPYGKVHYLQHLRRDHPLHMRAGQVYKLTVSFDPDVQREG